MASEPLAYFITFRCYGTWLHGDERGSMDRSHNEPRTPMVPADDERQAASRKRMSYPPYYLDRRRRLAGLQAVCGLAERKHWDLLALHVRTDHVHVVVRATGPIERVMNDCKTAASRRLNKVVPEENDRRRWERHGSTIYLWSDEQVADKVDYVLNQQGGPMERYPEPVAVDPGTRPAGKPR